jgi:phosphomannomutase / phosphoglucomutase
MAKKITVGEIAKRAEMGVREQQQGLDPKKAGFALLMGLCLGLAALAGLQCLNSLRSEWAAGGTKKAAERVAADLGKRIEMARVEVHKATLSADVAQLLSSSETYNYAAASAQAKAQLPEASDANLLQGADVSTAIGGKFAEFGFAKSDVLLEAQQAGRAVPAQLHFEKSTSSYTLVLAEPVKRGDVILGYLLAKFPTKDLKQQIEAGAGGGLLHLSEKGVHGDNNLISAGSGDDANAQRIEIPDSRLSVRWAGSSAFGLLPVAGWIMPGLLSLLGLGGAGLLGFLRTRPNIFADVGTKLRSKKTEEVAPSVPMQTPQQKHVAKQTQEKLEQLRAAEDVRPERIAENSEPSGKRSPVPSYEVDESIFRAYDIRGVVGSTLNEAVANLLGRALGSQVLEQGMTEMIVARDGRLSGPSLVKALIDGLRSTGCNVIDLGAVPTPVLYFATYQLNTGCGVMVTGSHNPPDYNGFKMMIGGVTLAEQAIKALRTRIVQRNFAEGSGSVQAMDVANDYVERISGDIQLETPLRVVVDAGNGIPGTIGPRLLQAVGCDVEPLYCDVDGNFPNHHPDPSDPKNLRDLISSVKQLNADVGIAFDGDGDRLGVVTRSGKIIYPDRLLMLFARDVLSRVPGASIIFDVKCTGALASSIRTSGGIPVMWKTGHSLIKGKMKEIDAALAGEMSGHFFFKERWYGFDDGLYAACRFLEILAASGLDADELFDDIPDAVSTPELKIEMQEGEHYRFMERFQKSAKFADARMTLIDGIRADFDEGWGLVRCSNTTPCLVLRFEGVSDVALRNVQQKFKQQLLSVDKNLKMPF